MGRNGLAGNRQWSRARAYQNYRAEVQADQDCSYGKTYAQNLSHAIVPCANICGVVVNGSVTAVPVVTKPCRWIIEAIQLSSHAPSVCL